MSAAAPAAAAAASTVADAAANATATAASAAATTGIASANPVPATAASSDANGEKASGGLLSLLGLTGAPTTPTPSPPPSHAFDGGMYTGGLRGSMPHGRGKLKLPTGVEVSGEWTDGVLLVGVLTNPSLSDSLHYEGELVRYTRHGKGMEWRLEDGEINRWGKWENNVLVAECPVPRAVITEGAFLAQEDMLSKLEFILADGTAARYEGARNAAGEPHGVGSMINAKGEVVRGHSWHDGAQDGEGFFVHIDGEKYTGHFKNGFKHGYGSHLFPDGELYEGQFRLNRKHGAGKQRWDDGYIYEGLWTHDEQNGWGIEYTKSGKISACGRWKDSELKEWHAVPRSVIPVGTYLNEKAKSADLLYSDGGYYKGEVNAAHEAHGKGILYTASNSIVQGGLFQHGKLHGEGFTNHPDGGRYCLGWGTRVMLADGTETAVENLSAGSALVSPAGRVVYAVNIDGHSAGNNLWDMLFRVEDTVAVAAENTTDTDDDDSHDGAWFEPFYVTANHRLTVGQSQRATVRVDPTTDNWSVVASRSVRFDPASAIAAPVPSDGVTTRAAAQAQADAWNARHNLPREARLWDIQAQHFTELKGEPLVEALAQKIRVPIHFTTEDASMAWLAAGVSTAMADARLAGTAHPLLPVTATGVTELDARVALLHQQWTSAAVVAGAKVYAADSPLRGDRYHSPAQADAAAETHEADFAMPAAALGDQAAERDAIKTWILRITGWVIGMWQTVGSADGTTIAQSPIDQRGVSHRFRRWIEALGYPTWFQSDSAVAPHQLVAHPAESSADSSLLRGLLRGLGLWEPLVGEKADQPDQLKQRFGQPAVRDRLVTMEPTVRMALMAGMIDANGTKSTYHGSSSFRLHSPCRSVLDVVVFMARTTGFNAHSPAACDDTNVWVTRSIQAPCEVMAQLDNAVAKNRTSTVDAEGVPAHHVDHFQSGMKVTSPTMRMIEAAVGAAEAVVREDGTLNDTGRESIVANVSATAHAVAAHAVAAAAGAGAGVALMQACQAARESAGHSASTLDADAMEEALMHGVKIGREMFNRAAFAKATAAAGVEAGMQAGAAAAAGRATVAAMAALVIAADDACQIRRYVQFEVSDVMNGAPLSEDAARFLLSSGVITHNSGEHRAGLREGFGKLSLANGDKYVGAFHANLQHGRGTYTWAKGDVYDGSWSDVRMHGIGKYSWPDGIVYLGEWVLGLQTGLGFKWSGLGTRPQFGRWLDNKLIQSLWVSPAVLAKMPGWTVEEFKAELEGKWAEMARTSAMQTAKMQRSNASTTATKKANGTAASGNTTPCSCTCKAKPCTCGCPCDRCVGSRSRTSPACCTHPTSSTTPADEWSVEVYDLIVKMRSSMEPHHFFQKNHNANK